MYVMRNITIITLLVVLFTACSIQVQFGNKNDEQVPDTVDNIDTNVEPDSTDNTDAAANIEMQPFISATTGITITYPVSWIVSDKGELMTLKPSSDDPFYINIFRELGANAEQLSIENYVSNVIRPKYEGTVEFTEDSQEFFTIDGRAAYRLKNIKTTNESFDKVILLDGSDVFNITCSASSVNADDYSLALDIIDSIRYPRTDEEIATQYESYSDQGFVIVYPDDWITVSSGGENSLLKLYYASSSERRDTGAVIQPETAVLKVFKHTEYTEDEVMEYITTKLNNVTTSEIQIFDLTATEIMGTSWQPQYIVLIPMPDGSIIEINASYSSETLLPKLKDIVRSFHIKP